MHIFKTKEDNIIKALVTKSHKYYNQNRTSSVLCMWRAGINFLFYFGIFPFKCEYCTESGQWYLKTSLFHILKTSLFDFIPDQQAPNFSKKFNKVFVQRFRTRFHMTISTCCTYTTMDYIFGILEVEIKNIFEMVSASCDTLISGLIPLTFIITVIKFEQVVLKMASKMDNSVLTLCRLFDHLNNMSKYINLNWGVMCLIWTFYNFSYNSFKLHVWILGTDRLALMYSINNFASMIFLLHFSGEAHAIGKYGT